MVEPQFHIPYLSDIPRYEAMARAWWQAHQWYVYGGAGALMAGAMGLRYALSRRERVTTSETWGSARWATLPEVRRAGLLGEQGVVIGRLQGQTLRSHQGAHVLVCAPSQTGKTTSVIIPTLLSWPGSAIVLDVKSELYDSSAGYRGGDIRDGGLGQAIYRFNPLRRDSHRINLLGAEFLRIGTSQEVGAVQRFTQQLSAPESPSTAVSDYWRQQAQDLLLMVGLWLPYQTAVPCTLGGMLHLLSHPTMSTLEVLQDVATSSDAIVASIARRFLKMPRDARDGVWDSAIRLVTLWRDPLVDHVTSGTDLDFQAFQQGPRAQTLYLQVNPEDLKGIHRPLFRLLWQAIVALLMDRKVTRYDHPLLLVLDEFPTMGYLAPIEEAFSLLAGYGIRILAAMQSLNQLWKGYTKDTSILDNCAIRVMFSPNSLDTAQTFSDLLGHMTVEDTQTSQSWARHGLLWRHRAERTQTHQRPLLTAAEWMEIDPEMAVIRVPNRKPIRAQKVRYYEDAVYRQRAGMRLGRTA